MISPYLSLIIQYGGAVLTGIIVGLFFKAYFASKVNDKIRGYQSDIVKSHAKILELEAKNDQLEKRVKEAERVFNKDQIFMN